MKILITILFWCLVLLIITSALVPFTHSGLFPFLQILPSFDVIFWVFTLALLVIASVSHMRPWLPIFTFILATALVVWRGYGSMPEFDFTDEIELKVLCLNVSQFDNDTAVVQETIRQIQEIDPDILCMQEFGLYYKWPDVASVAADFAQRTSLQYYEFTPHPGNIFGTAVFSKFPILSTDTIFSMLSATNEAKAYVFDIDGKELRLTNVHLQSYNIFGSRKKKDHSLGDDLAETLSRRKSQVRVLMQHKADIVVGDMNASVGSYYYESIASKWRDVQRAFGLGLLPTHAIVPTRLDYIFTKQRMRPIDFERVTDFPTDHYGLVATVAL